MQQKAIACAFTFPMTRLTPQLKMPPRTRKTGPCKTAHLARGKESPWRTANRSVVRLPILPFCTSHHDFALLGWGRSGCNKAAMSNASLISSNEVIKWYWAKCAALNYAASVLRTPSALIARCSINLGSRSPVATTLTLPVHPFPDFSTCQFGANRTPFTETLWCHSVSQIETILSGISSPPITSTDDIFSLVLDCGKRR